MKESKVHLVSTALAKNNSQNYFYTNHNMEILKEQTSVNHRLINSVSQLDQSCKTILSELHNQSLTLNKLNNNHKYDYVNLKKILFNLAQTSRGYGSHLQKQQYTLQAINEQLDKQSKFNELSINRATNHDKALNQLQGGLNRQRNFLNNFAIKQNSSFENIKQQLDHQEEVNVQLQNRLEEQKRLLTIVSNYPEQQNHFHQLYSIKQDQLLDENKEFFINLQSQLNNQEKMINILSDNHNSQMNLVFHQLKEQKHYLNKSSEKQQLSEEMDELILEEINLQITQQDDIYNYLQDSLKRQQGFLLQLSDSQNRQLDKLTTDFKNIKAIDAQQVKALSEVKESIEKLLNIKGNLGILLSKLPPNYPIKQIVVGGVPIDVEKLLLVNQKIGIAFVSNGMQTISFDIEKIEAIHWE